MQVARVVPEHLVEVFDGLVQRHLLRLRVERHREVQALHALRDRGRVVERLVAVPLVAAKADFVDALRASEIASTVIAPSGFFSDMAVNPLLLSGLAIPRAPTDTTPGPNGKSKGRAGAFPILLPSS